MKSSDSSPDSAPGADLLPLREAAARYLSALAYPANARQREKFQVAARAWYWKSVRAATGEWFGNEWAAAVPSRSIWESGPIPRAGKIIAQKRLPAALAAESLVHGRARTVGEALGIAGASDLLQRAADTLSVGLVDHDENRKRRIWRQSRPVLHLALALHAVVLKAAEASQRGHCVLTLDITDLLEHVGWVTLACRAAHAYVPALAAAPINLQPPEVWPVDAICKFGP